MLLTGNHSIEQITDDQVRNIIFHPVPEDQFWRINMVKELQKIRSNELRVDGIDQQMLDDMFLHVCIS